MAEMSEPTVQSDSVAELSQAFEQIHLDKDKLPPELRECFDLQKLKDALLKATSLSVLLSGRAGAGKSTLVNGILGKRVAKEGDKVIRGGETSKLTEYSRNVDGVNVTVWDSPGLGDGSDNQVQSCYIREMREKCSKVDLTLYCIKMFEKWFPRGRTDNPDVNAMANITEAFGSDFWRNTIVVLTFANLVEAMNVAWENLDASAKKVEFEKELENWRGIIRDVLINEIKVPREIAMSVVIVPAGHHLKRKLPDRDYWLSTLWFQCLEAIATPEGRVALVRTNVPRMRQQNQVTEKDFGLPPEDQPIVVEGSSDANKYKVVAAAIGGAGIAIGIGAAGVAITGAAATGGAGIVAATTLGPAIVGAITTGGTGLGASLVGAELVGSAGLGVGAGIGAAGLAAIGAPVGLAVGVAAAVYYFWKSAGQEDKKAEENK